MDAGHTHRGTQAALPLGGGRGLARAWLAPLLAALPLAACVAAAALALALREPPVRSYEDQVASGLRRSGVAYSGVTLGERWPDHINFQYGSLVFPYGYRVRIQLQGGAVDGWLRCAQLERGCSLSVADLGLRDVPLPDFAPRRELPLPAWLRPYVERVLP